MVHWIFSAAGAVALAGCTVVHLERGTAGALTGGPSCDVVDIHIGAYNVTASADCGPPPAKTAPHDGR